MVDRLRGRLKRSRAAIIAVNLVRYAWLSVANRIRPDRPTRIGARHEGFSLDESTAYVDWVVGDYERHCGLGREALADTRVLELGPGDNLGVALRLLAMGADRVVCLDRFVTWRDPAQQRKINLALLERMSPGDRERVAGVVASDGEVPCDQERLVLIEGTGVENADEVLQPASFDAVISRAVLGQVFDLDAAYIAMDRLLAPGGRMAHKIDLSDMRLFSAGGHHPLTYLTIREAVWDRMRRQAGHSNRRLVDYHRDKLAELGYEAELLASTVIGRPGELAEPVDVDRIAGELGEAGALVEQIRPRLIERYRRLPAEDLAVGSVFVRARKPSG